MKSMLKLLTFSVGMFLGFDSAFCETPVENITPAKTEAAQKLMQAMNIDDTIKKMKDGFMQNIIQRDPCMAPFQKVINDFFDNALNASLKSDIVNLYTLEFTASELDELTAFYNSPIGKKYTEKMPEIGVATARIMANILKTQGPEFQKRMQEAEKTMDSTTLPPQCRRPNY